MKVRIKNPIWGVPITFLYSYNPKQFEIIGQMANTNITETNFGYPFVNGKKKYARILIKRKMKIRIKNPIYGIPITFLYSYNPSQFEIVDINPHFFALVAQGFEKPKQLTLHNVNKKDPYARILIKRK